VKRAETRVIRPAPKPRSWDDTPVGPGCSNCTLRKACHVVMHLQYRPSLQSFSVDADCSFMVLFMPPRDHLCSTDALHCLRVRFLDLIPNIRFRFCSMRCVAILVGKDLKAATAQADGSVRTWKQTARCEKSFERWLGNPPLSSLLLALSYQECLKIVSCL
jgi:hypothetical protein